MFISTVEKIHLKNSIEALSKIVGDMNAELVYLSAKMKALEAKPAPKPIKKTYKKKKITAEQREKQREYARRYQAKKRLEKQNGNGISTTGQ
jgi:hypothetical protein